MALLATLTQGDVSLRKEKAWDPRPDMSVRHNIPGWRPKGLTQPCGELASTNYSSMLKQTIYEMMYSEPDFRPNLQVIKTRVQEGWRVANEVSPGGEPWEDFIHPDPMEPEWDPDAWNPDDEIEISGPSPVFDFDREKWGHFVELLKRRNVISHILSLLRYLKRE